MTEHRVCVVLTATLVVGLAGNLVYCGSRWNEPRIPSAPAKQQATVKAEPRHPEHVRRDVQPSKIEFYSHNALFEGARISIKNAAGKVMWVQLPGRMVKKFRRDWRLEGFHQEFDISPDFDLTRGYEMVVHFKDGYATRFARFEHIGDGHPYGRPSFYLHVCEGLRPHIVSNGTGEDEKHPVTEFRVPTDEEIAAQMKG